MNRDGIPRIRREGRGGTWKAQGGCDRGQDSPHTPSHSYQTHNRSIGSFGTHTTFIAPPPFRRPTKVTSAPRLNHQQLNASTPSAVLVRNSSFQAAHQLLPYFQGLPLHAKLYPNSIQRSQIRRRPSTPSAYCPSFAPQTRQITHCMREAQTTRSSHPAVEFYRVSWSAGPQIQIVLNAKG